MSAGSYFVLGAFCSIVDTVPLGVEQSWAMSHSAPLSTDLPFFISLDKGNYTNDTAILSILE